MAISSALYSGISGMNTNGTAMSVIGNNIANTNTIGYKSSRTVFSDLLASSINGSGGAAQVGRGVGLSTVDNLFSQGTFETTESQTDLAIEGDGLFVVREEGSENYCYTRAGSFRFDGNGYLTNPEGYRVQGKPYVDGILSGTDPIDIQVDINGSIPASMTTEVTLSTNLNANSETIGALVDINGSGYTDTVTSYFAPDNPASYNYSSTVTVYDSLGNTHPLTTFFTKVSDNTWDLRVVDENDQIVYSTAEPSNQDNRLVFDSTGNWSQGGDYGGDPADTTTGTPIPYTTYDLGDLTFGDGTTAQPIVLDLSNTTQFASDSQVISQTQDGYAAGNLTNVAINNDGDVIAQYSNGEEFKISRIVLAKFSNFNGLQKEGASMFSATSESGAARIGIPGEELGKVFTNALEQSTVDLAAEFVKMITTQRGFQANSKVITTTDEMLSELINLKR